MASEKQLNEAIDGLEIGLLGMRNREAGYIQRITQLEADLKTAEDRLKLTEDLMTTDYKRMKTAEADCIGWKDVAADRAMRIDTAEAERDRALGILGEIEKAVAPPEDDTDTGLVWTDAIKSILSRIDQPYECKGCGERDGALTLAVECVEHDADAMIGFNGPRSNYLQLAEIIKEILSRRPASTTKESTHD